MRKLKQSVQQAVTLVFLVCLVFSFSTPVFAQDFSLQAPPPQNPYQTIEETHYIDKYFEIDQDGNFKNHIYLGDQKLADIVYDAETNSEEIFYTSSDHLGSTSVVTDEAGNVVELHDYYPFGAQNYQEIAQDAKTSQLFTGKENDLETLLYYFGARYYDQSRGQFISVDPFGQTLTELNNQQLNTFLADPQRLNAYAYASNNPINNFDKDGNLSIKALQHPGAAAAQLAFWHSGINGYLRPQGLSATAALLGHSLSWRPTDLNISSANQGNYGNIIEQIKNSSEYKNFVTKQISALVLENRDSFSTNDINNNSLEFTTGDLALSIHKAKIEKLDGSFKDGKWIIDVQLSDEYNFEFKSKLDAYENQWFATSANNAAAISQNIGVISSYDINIDFKDEISF